ncbi:MAG: insulinase family protein [Clostridia bacterium]|nr:insulinase family protein [Clostridia bacterium]MBP3360219.1 insulinase family protein [Clostridia bacterium]
MLKVIPINDNIRLNYIPMDKLKTTSMGMYIHRKLKKEDASKNAILPHILKRGCKLCSSSQEIARYLENLYGAKFSAGIGKRGDDHLLCFEFETISDKYAPRGERLAAGVVKLMMSMVFGSLDEFDKDSFEQERANSITKIENIINDKRIYANYRCQEEMARGDSFEIPRLGYVEDMKALTREEVYAYYKEIIVNSPIDIYVCGDANIRELEAEIRKGIEGFEFKKAEMPSCTILRRNSQVKNITEKLNVTQGKLSMGFLTDMKPTDENYFALLVANAIFGGGAQSKLFNNVREKLSLAYYAGSILDKFKGIMMVNAGIEFDNFEKAYNEIMAQLDEMKKGNITDLELEASKGFLINSLTSYYDDQHSMISFYLNEKIGQTFADIDQCIERIKLVTKADAVDAMSDVKLDTVYFLTGREEQ